MAWKSTLLFYFFKQMLIFVCTVPLSASISEATGDIHI